MLEEISLKTFSSMKSQIPTQILVNSKCEDSGQKLDPKGNGMCFDFEKLDTSEIILPRQLNSKLYVQ